MGWPFTIATTVVSGSLFDGGGTFAVNEVRLIVSSAGADPRIVAEAACTVPSEFVVFAGVVPEPDAFSAVWLAGGVAVDLLVASLRGGGGPKTGSLVFAGS